MKRAWWRFRCPTRLPQRTGKDAQHLKLFERDALDWGEAEDKTRRHVTPIRISDNISGIVHRSHDNRTKMIS